jgi:hypothetical protein
VAMILDVHGLTRLAVQTPAALVAEAALANP